MKFQLAPCHRPPSSMVFMELMLVVMSLRSAGFFQAHRPMAPATSSTARPTHQLPLRKAPIMAMATMMI